MNLQRSLLIKMFIVLETKNLISGVIIGFLFSDDLLIGHKGGLLKLRTRENVFHKFIGSGFHKVYIAKSNCKRPVSTSKGSSPII